MRRGRGDKAGIRLDPRRSFTSFSLRCSDSSPRPNFVDGDTTAAESRVYSFSLVCVRSGGGEVRVFSLDLAHMVRPRFAIHHHLP